MAQGPRTNVELLSPALWHNRFERQVAVLPQHAFDPGHMILSGYARPPKPKQVTAFVFWIEIALIKTERRNFEDHLAIIRQT